VAVPESGDDVPRSVSSLARLAKRRATFPLCALASAAGAGYEAGSLCGRLPARRIAPRPRAFRSEALIPYRALVCVLSAVLAAPVAATPPGDRGRFADWRELDPVARDAYSAAPADVPAPPRTPPGVGDRRDTVGAFLETVAELILRTFTMPLGTVRPDGPR
jgi:hypothetical protein